MIRYVREFRLIPVVLIATVSLFALKVAGLMFNGSYTLPQGSRDGNTILTFSLSADSQELTTPMVKLDGMDSPPPKQSWMQQMFGYPEVTGSINPAARQERSRDVTGSSSAPAKPAEGGEKPKDAASDKPPAPPKPTGMNGAIVPLDGGKPISAAERAILERLQQRREELDKRARELDMRESVIKEAETKLDARANDAKTPDAKGGPAGAARKEDAPPSGYKNLAIMYENMKAKDAAKIFDRLDIKILLDMTAQINPRKMSEILAQMNPEAAERLTNELAARASGQKSANSSDLPKIEGRPTDAKQQ